MASTYNVAELTKSVESSLSMNEKNRFGLLSFFLALFQISFSGVYACADIICCAVPVSLVLYAKPGQFTTVAV